jgi:hypothetical protein
VSELHAGFYDVLRMFAVRAKQAKGSQKQKTEGTGAHEQKAHRHQAPTGLSKSDLQIQKGGELHSSWLVRNLQCNCLSV